MKLYDYQELGRDFLRAHDRAALFLDMGLGKTATTLAALEPRHLPALVVAPPRVAENVWHAEAELWRPDLKVVRAVGSPAQRARALAEPADVTIISMGTLGDAEALDPRFSTLIIDELSAFKSRGVRWKTAKRLMKRQGFDHVWGLTGSPTPNGLLDLWPQMMLIDGGKRLGTTVTGFRSRYFYPGAQLPSGVIIEWIMREGAEQAIHRKLEDIALAMESDGRVELPAVTYNDVEVPLPPGVRTAYRKLKKDLVVNLRELGLGDGTHTAETRAIVSNKLGQMTAGFIFSDDADINGRQYTVLHRQKVKAAREIVDGTGGPVIIAYRFRPELEMLKEEFGKLAHTADVPDLQERWNAGELPVLLAHPASIGHGLNMQKGPGHTLIWASLTWSLEEWQQLNKRLVRQGQTRPVVIHRLISPGTVDPHMVEVLEGKTTVQRALLDHLESPL